jgi:hypothetical protein
MEPEIKTSFINESVSSIEQLLENNKDIAASCKEGIEDSIPTTVSKSIWTECDKDDFVEKQSVAVQVSADFTLLNKEIAEQSTSCQTDNEELNYCVSKAMNTAENITSTGTFKRERNTEKPKDDEAHIVEKTDKKKEMKLETVESWSGEKRKCFRRRWGKLVQILIQTDLIFYQLNSSYRMLNLYYSRLSKTLGEPQYFSGTSLCSLV